MKTESKKEHQVFKEWSLNKTYVIQKEEGQCVRIALRLGRINIRLIQNFKWDQIQEILMKCSFVLSRFSLNWVYDISR